MTSLLTPLDSSITPTAPAAYSRERHGAAETRSVGPVRRWSIAAFALAMVAGSLYALRRELASVRYHRVSDLVNGIPADRIAWALGLTAACYAAMLCYDALALRYVRRRLAPRRTAFASFLAYAFSQNFGISALTGASIRYRFWSSWGLSSEEIAQGVAFTTVSFWLGVLLLAGVTLLASPMQGAPVAHTVLGSRLLGAAVLVPLVAYVVWSAKASHPLVFRGWAFRAPTPSLALSQLVVACIDWTLAGAVLWVLFPADSGIGFLHLLAVFLLAQIAGLISHVPGGLSVFEWVMLSLLGGAVPSDALIATLVAYRVIYYLVPFAIAILAFAAYELAARRRPMLQMFRSLGRVAGAAAPFWLGGATFAAGVILLVSGSTPSLHSRMRWLDSLFPLGVMEVSHFVASVAGVGLLFLGNGLRRRLDGAYHVTLIVLLVGVVASLLKGFDWEEATVLATVFAVLYPARRHFYRRTALLAEPLTPGWIVSIVVALVGSVWLGFFSFKHVDYASALWWRFATTADAPRFLRASVGAAVVALGLAGARLLRPAAGIARRPSPDDLRRAKDIAQTVHESGANLALLGDKSLLFSPSGRSFIQYGVWKRSWVALGDPIGDPSEFAELAWEFVAQADRAGAWPVFYEVNRAHLPLYIDLGLTLLKLGEEARVELSKYSLEGGNRKPQRRIVKDCEKAGATFRVLSPSEVTHRLGDLRAVSDQWLAGRKTREKGFSLGFFDEEYLSHFPVAVVEVSDRIVAFANIWTSGGQGELSVDLMRYSEEAPRSVMEYLFIETMLWGKAQGYAWFNLGMAPLSGFERRALAPVWHRIGSLLYRQGEHFYNFRGLRAYKEKFDPVWEPRYLASRAGLALPRILVHVAALVSGGLRGVLAR